MTIPLNLNLLPFQKMSTCFFTQIYFSKCPEKQQLWQNDVHALCTIWTSAKSKFIHWMRVALYTQHTYVMLGNAKNRLWYVYFLGDWHDDKSNSASRKSRHTMPWCACALSQMQYWHCTTQKGLCVGLFSNQQFIQSWVAFTFEVSCDN